jgi:pimeloyl-ACP methyl ester carboxylesterase
VLERAYNVVHRRHAVDGGHFLAFEQPELFLDEVRAFFRPFRRPPRA